MNNKRTNYLIAILNIIVVITIILIIIFAENIVRAANDTYNNGIMKIESLYECHALEILLENLELIINFVYGTLGIANIVSAIQNRKNKKIFFWQLTFGISIILYMGIYYLLSYNLYKWSTRIIVGVIPIIFAIINIIKTRKNKPTRIQFISYIIVIVIAIVGLIYKKTTILFIWNVIQIIMQFIYIHKQEKNIDESNAKKIVNIILYYVIETLIVTLFFSITVISIVNTKINDFMFRKEVSDLYKKIYNMQGIENDEIYIPVEKNSKYGYIDENNKEKITTEYDRVTFFLNGKIEGKECHFALVEKDGSDYIISKSNDRIEISNNKYLKLFKNLFGKVFDKSSKKYKDYTTNNTDFTMEYLKGNSASDIYSVSEENYDWNEVDNLEEEKEIEIKLEEINHKYHYKTENYTIEIEQLEEAHYYETKARIKVTKKDGTISSNIEKITIDDDKRIKTLSNGCIAFENEEGYTNGWYDKYGNRIQIGGNYELLDIKYNKIFIYDYENYIYYILNMNGKTILKTEALDIFNYNDKILMKNKNNKMVICDGELNEISNEYDKIIISSWIDMTPEFSSYGKKE